MHKDVTVTRIRLSSVAVNCGVLVLSVLISMSTVMGKPSPFAASFMAALSGMKCFSAFAGSVAGFLALGDYDSFVIVCSSLLAVMAVRLILKKNESSAVSVVMCMTCAGSVFAANFITSRSVSEIMGCFALAALSGGGALVILHLKKLYRQRALIDITVKNNPVSIVTLLTSCVIVTSILTRYSVGIFDLGIITAVTISIYCSMWYGAAAGTVAGAAGAVGVYLGSGAYPFSGAVLAVAGCMGAVAKGERKSATAGIYVLTSVLCIVLFGMDNSNLALTADIFMGCAVFMLLPAVKGGREEAVSERNIKENSAKQLFTKRLQFAGEAISEVRRTIDYTAKKLDDSCNNDISWVYNTACDKVCRKCRYNMQCWGNEYYDSIKQFARLTNEMKQGVTLKEDMFSSPLKERCQKKQELCSKIEQLYKSYVNSLSDKRNIARMRSVLTVQLSATEKLLSDLAEKCGSDDYENSLGTAATDVLCKLGCDNISAVNVSMGDNGRVSVEAYLENSGNGENCFFPDREETAAAMSLKFHRTFELPVITRIDSAVKLSMFTKTRYMLSLEACQISKDENAPCGDYYDSFVSAQGVAYIALSDGMGSGSRARIDSVFACDMLLKLLKAGISPESAMDTVSTALMLKSSDESFATLDLCTVDLYSGKTAIYKAGSASTYIKCGAVNTRLCCKGKPIGISEKAEYEVKTFTIGSGDMIVMTSDGAELNEKWMFREMNRETKSLSDFSKMIAETAKFYAGNGKGDDVTVVALRIDN